MSRIKLTALVAVAAMTAMLAACGQPASNSTTTVTNTTTTTNTTIIAPANDIIAGGVTDAADAADAKAFVEGLYVHYRTNNGASSTWAPMDANSKDVLDPDLMALTKADDALLKGDVGAIETDWICDCQDWESITATVSVVSATPTTAKVAAVFSDKTEVGQLKHDSFSLVKTPAGWRIDDMGTDEDPSLRAVLTKEIAELKSGKPVD